jgi:hypothetical protein
MWDQTRTAALGAVGACVLLSCAQANAQANVQDAPLLPPDAKPGQCYTRLFVPPQYESRKEELIAVDSSDHLEVSPPQFEWVEEQVLVKEESEQIEVIPATYKEVTEEVMVKPAWQEFEVVPAEFETVEEQVLVREAYTTWKKGRGPVEKLDASTGEIMCLVEVPAEYQTIKRRKLKIPPSTRVIEHPAEYKTVKKQVVEKPAETRVSKTPAKYITVKVQKQVAPAKTDKTRVPEEVLTVERTVKVSDGRVEWRQILCETNMTRDVIADVQAALQELKLYRGPVDGSLGPMTMASVRAFQREKNLASGQLTIETLEALGVTP